jgi:hypothetical protein
MLRHWLKYEDFRSPTLVDGVCDRPYLHQCEPVYHRSRVGVVLQLEQEVIHRIEHACTRLPRGESEPVLDPLLEADFVVVSISPAKGQSKLRDKIIVE